MAYVIPRAQPGVKQLKKKLTTVTDPNQQTRINTRINYLQNQNKPAQTQQPVNNNRGQSTNTTVGQAYGPDGKLIGSSTTVGNQTINKDSNINFQSALAAGQKSRTNLLNQIHAKGGIKNAPGLYAQLQAQEAKNREYRRQLGMGDDGNASIPSGEVPTDTTQPGGETQQPGGETQPPADGTGDTAGDGVTDTLYPGEDEMKDTELFPDSKNYWQQMSGAYGNAPLYVGQGQNIGPTGDKSLTPGLDAFLPQNYEGSPLYKFRLAEGQKALDRVMSARGLTTSGAEIDANQKMVNEISGEESDRLQRMSETEADRVERLRTGDANRRAQMENSELDRNFQGGQQNAQRKAQMQLEAAGRLERIQQAESNRQMSREDAQWNRLMTLLDLQLSQNPMNWAADMTKQLGSLDVGQATALASFLKQNYPKAIAGGGGGGSVPPPPFTPPGPSGPDTSMADILKIISGGSNRGNIGNSISDLIGAFF